MKDRIVTASIGLKLSTIDEIQSRANKEGTTFSLEGRKLIEEALGAVSPPERVSEPVPSPLAILGQSTDAPI
jgi:hypothetical protein